jgi:hypothetical protein
MQVVREWLGYTLLGLSWEITKDSWQLDIKTPTCTIPECNVDSYTSLPAIYKTVKIAFPLFLSFLCLKLPILFGVMKVKKLSNVDDFRVMVGVAIWSTKLFCRTGVGVAGTGGRRD